MTKQPGRRSGFTLLELLVVVSIISLLMGLFLPYLRQAREQSKQLVCKKNLKNLWRGIVVYSMEYGDRVPFLERAGPEVDPFDATHPTLVGTVLGPYVERGSFVCPSAVAGYPETDPTSRRKWKLTYDFSAASPEGEGIPYDAARGAYSGEDPDPALVNEYHFDGRPMRMIRVGRETSYGLPETPSLPGNSDQVVIIWTVSVPLVADTLAEDNPGDIAAGRPRYPHRGVVRRQTDVYRSLMTASDPRLVSARRPGYFHLHAEKDREQVFLTRHSPDADPNN